MTLPWQPKAIASSGDDPHPEQPHGNSQYQENNQRDRQLGSALCLVSVVALAVFPSGKPEQICQAGSNNKKQKTNREYQCEGRRTLYSPT
jgi:hypothetical protein